jgi:hypothetical protein
MRWKQDSNPLRQKYRKFPHEFIESPDRCGPAAARSKKSNRRWTRMNADRIAVSICVDLCPSAVAENFSYDQKTCQASFIALPVGDRLKKESDFPARKLPVRILVTVHG